MNIENTKTETRDETLAPSEGPPRRTMTDEEIMDGIQSDDRTMAELQDESDDETEEMAVEHTPAEIARAGQAACAWFMAPEAAIVAHPDRVEWQDSTDRGKDGLRDEVAILLAGWVAMNWRFGAFGRKRIFNTLPPRHHKIATLETQILRACLQGLRDDTRRARDIGFRLEQIDRMTMEDQDSSSRNLADGILSTSWDKVETLALALLERRKLSIAELAEVVGPTAHAKRDAEEAEKRQKREAKSRRNKPALPAIIGSDSIH